MTLILTDFKRGLKITRDIQLGLGLGRESLRERRDDVRER
jgi:hypothetical protein